jgi:hypothetical protein
MGSSATRLPDAKRFFFEKKEPKNFLELVLSLSGEAEGK